MFNNILYFVASSTTKTNLMRSLILTVATLILLNVQPLKGQETKKELPYASIPEYGDDYHSGAILSLFIEGLGYRYHWATEGLRAEDLAFKPSEDARSSGETIDHILGLSNAVLNAALKQPNTRTDTKDMTFEEIRAKTLDNFQKAATIFKEKAADKIGEHKIIYKRGEQESTFPLWNLINGQISDALYHVGQITSYRRTSGNPLNPKVNVFMGKNRQ